MFVKNIPNDCVFFELKQENEVYCFDPISECLTDLLYEPIKEVNKRIKDSGYVFFKVESEDMNNGN